MTFLELYAKHPVFPYCFPRMTDDKIIRAWIAVLTKYPDSDIRLLFLPKVRDSSKKYLLDKLKHIENNLEKYLVLI